MTPAVNFYARGFCFDKIQCEKILRQCIKIGYSWAQCIKRCYNSVMYEDRVKIGNV